MSASRTLFGAALIGLATYASAQNASLKTAPSDPASILSSEAYIKPPPEIEKLVLAPRWQNVALTDISPDRTRYLITQSDGMPALAQLGRSHRNLGGFQVDTAANRSRNSTIRSAAGLSVFEIATSTTLPIEVPKGARVGSATWSPDGGMIAFVANFDDRTMLYVADSKTGKSRLLTKQPLLATAVTTVDWTGDGKGIAVVLIPEKRAAFPSPSLVANEPKVRVGDVSKHRFRTYPSLLENPNDQALLEYYTTGQLALIDLRGKVHPIGAPAMFQSIDVSPDGNTFRVRTMQKPFSYLVPVDSFGSKEELWDPQGKLLAEIVKTPLRLAEASAAQGPGGQPPATGKRSLMWRPDGQGLSYIEVEPRAPTPPQGGGEATDEQGRGGRRGPGAVPQDNRKDRVMQWLAPYGKDDAKVVWTAEGRISGVRYSQDCKTLFVTDTKDGSDRCYAVFLSEPGKIYPISTAKSDEFYDAPGTLLGRAGSNGAPIVTISSDGAVYLAGTKYGKDPRSIAPKPFADRVVIRTGEKKRIFESSDSVYETFGSLIDDDAKQAVITRQSPSLPSNAFLLDLTDKTAKQLTQNRDVTPELTACQRFIVDVKRLDGFKFQAKVTMPASWKHAERLPAVFWFYPSEFADQAAYDRTLRTYNKNAFTAYSGQSMAIFTQLGYAFVEPDVPIVGPDATVNDNYVPDLRNSLYAVINKLDAEGYVDRERLAISGHSYGAFSTANALVQTPFFKAGIAGSGDYNRSLTPFGFQSEQRQLWDARELYEEMSPFRYADRLNGALLMTHGMEDQNIGTNPINSERLFQALSELGKPCALYMYPYEDHGQIAKETVLDKWARWAAWLDNYLKSKP